MRDEDEMKQRKRDLLEGFNKLSKEDFYFVVRSLERLEEFENDIIKRVEPKIRIDERSRLRSLIEKKIHQLEQDENGASIYLKELLSELGLSGTEKDESENLYPERPSGRMTDTGVLASSPSEIPAEQEERNPMHFCFNGCGEFLGHRGFCSKECHDEFYDKEAENGGKVEMGESPSDSAGSRKLIQDLLPSEIPGEIVVEKDDKAFDRTKGALNHLAPYLEETSKCSCGYRAINEYIKNPIIPMRTGHYSDCPLSKKEGG